MVTILNRRRHGYDVRMYYNDHGRPHVHVIQGERYARIMLHDLRPTHNDGFSNRQIRRIGRLLEANMDLLMSEWQRLRIHD